MDLWMIPALFGLGYVIWRLERPRKGPGEQEVPPREPLGPPALQEWERRLVKLEEKVEGLPSLWDQVYARSVEEREQAHRFKERARKHEERANELMEELEGEPEEVRRVDAEPRQIERVQPVRNDVESDPFSDGIDWDAAVSLGYPYV